MAATWKRSDGDIADGAEDPVRHRRNSTQSLGKKFKDPMHYAVSAVRATYGDQVILNPLPLINWLNRMGEPLYGHETPDGYPLTAAAWSGPGEMATRFEIAQQIGTGARNLFKPITPEMLANLRANLKPIRKPRTVCNRCCSPTRRTGAGAGAAGDGLLHGADADPVAGHRQRHRARRVQADRNVLFLSSPEFMRR